MDTYQAVFDAVRSRLSNGDIGAAVEAAIREANLSHYALMAQETIRGVAAEYERPSVLYKASLRFDGSAWCARLGDDPLGFAAYGPTPNAAMKAFDTAWYAKQ